MRSLTPYVAFLLALATPVTARTEDGYDLWLRYRLVADTARLAEYRRAFAQMALDGNSPTLRVAAGNEGFVIRTVRFHGHRAIVIAANRDIGVLYGAFHLLRLVQTNTSLSALNVV